MPAVIKHVLWSVLWISLCKSNILQLSFGAGERTTFSVKNRHRLPEAEPEIAAPNVVAFLISLQDRFSAPHTDARGNRFLTSGS